MKTEQAKQIVDNAIEELGQAIEAGRSQTLTTYLAAMSRFYRYSFTNTLLIAVQRPDASRVAGFQAWRKLGRHVRKGEHGITIFAPMVCSMKNHDDLHDHQQLDATAPTAKVLRGFKAAYVFDVSQTDGEPLPEFAPVTGDPGQYLERLQQFVEQQGVSLVYDYIPHGARGMSEPGRVTVRPDMDNASQFSVLVHEVAHQILHQSERRHDTTLTSRETEAEAVSYIVSKAIGLDTSTHASDYIQLYQGQKLTLMDSFTVIQKTASQILTAVQPEA